MDANRGSDREQLSPREGYCWIHGRIARRERADQDVQEAIDYYVQDAPEYALAFIDALEHAYLACIARQP